MTPSARALTARTGHPALKLVLLTVAAYPSWPDALDVTAACELGDAVVVDALAELVRQRLVAEHRAPGDVTRYSLAEDGWDAGRVDTPDEAPAEWTATALRTGQIGGYAFGTRQVRA